MASEHTSKFSREAFRIAGLIVRPDKSCSLPIGLDLELSNKITEEEVKKISLDFSLLCDLCGVWRGATLRSLNAHKALQCPRGVHDEGHIYVVERILDEAETSRGTHLRVKWQGYPQDSWEPMWELMGNETKEGFAREAVEAYRVAVVQPDWVSTPRGG